MSFETNLERIAASLELIAASLSAKPVSVTTPVATPVVEATPVVATVQVTPVVAPTAMPPTPVFTQAVAVAPVGVTVAAAPQAPAFADKAAMMDFVIASYKALGQEKGAKIQEVLTGMGFQNVNDVDPARWGELKAGIEGLK